MIKAITIYALIHLAWVTYCICEGKRDGYFYFLTPSSYDKYPDLHKLYTLQRSCMVIAILIVSSLIGNYLSALNFFTLALSFSYFHNGSYFSKRNDLNPQQYRKRWKDDSSTSRALINFKYPIRLLQAIISLVLFTSGLVYLIFINYYV